MTTFLQVMNEKLKKKKHLGMILSSHLEFRVKWVSFSFAFTRSVNKKRGKDPSPLGPIILKLF